MQTYNYHIQEDNYTELFDKEYETIIKQKSILIQVFSGKERGTFENLLLFLRAKFPNAQIIASSTDGEIYEGSISLFSSVVSISTFDATELNLAYASSDCPFEVGVELAKQLVTPKTKLLIAFTDGLHCNGEEFLEGIYSIAPHIKVAGGLSGDNAKFESCYFGIQDKLYDKGGVAVAFDSEVLHVQTIYNFGWKNIGCKHVITNSDKNRVYTIDNIKAVDFYKRYLGEEIAQELPSTGIEFPLIMTKDGVDVARAVTAMHPDGSLSFAGNLLKGKEVYFGVGNIEEILLNPFGDLKSVSVESFFIYSCMARRRFMPELIVDEITPFSTLAPTSGFFTYGEFYTKSKAELLNQTLTAVALSESDLTININRQKKPKYYEKNRLALMNILAVTTKELTEEMNKIEVFKKETEIQKNNMKFIEETMHLGNWEMDIQSGAVTWSKESFEIYGRDPSLGTPTYSEFVEMVIKEDRAKLADEMKKLDDGQTHHIEIRVQRDDKKILTIIESAKMIFQNDKPLKIMGLTLDITEIRLKENILLQQSKQAQMGEMINMIAHQWRQPLNAISASAIQLNIKNDMEIITSEDIKKIASFIGKTVQDMSNTINDFMNFSKPTNGKELVSIQRILGDILHLMGAQLKNHNIAFLTDLQEGVALSIYRKDLEHVLINLIVNARDAFDDKNIEDKKILVKSYIRDQRCVIEVIDNAGGVPMDVIDRVFEPYFTTKEHGKGTGLGLYMSKKIVRENLDGDINVQNLQDGAKFSVELQDCFNE